MHLCVYMVLQLKPFGFYTPVDAPGVESSAGGWEAVSSLVHSAARAPLSTSPT